jgi:stage V sporulation protein D (sporulation-specific penicillin-binding protein)
VAYSYDTKPRRRIALLNIGLGALGCIVAGKLFLLQIIHHDYYVASAASEQSRKFTVPAERGQIYILDGADKTPLALNQTLETVYADPTEITDKDQTALQLASALGMNYGDIRPKLDGDTHYSVIRRGLLVSQGDKVDALNLTGVGTSKVQGRTYPEGSLAAQVLGFVNGDGVGQYGLEGYLNNDLTGTPGLLRVRTDTQGNPIAIANNFERSAAAGKSYVLTLDRNIQAQAEKYLKKGVEDAKADSGSVVVVDPNTGAIMAMANYPTYDPNSYGSVTDYNVFDNSVVSNQYEPGSVFKPVTMSAALDSNKVKADDTYVDTGSVEVDGRTIRNSENKTYGKETMTDIIQKSLNTGVVFLLKSMGGDPNGITLAGKRLLADYIKRFGFGVATGIEQQSEASGAVNAPSAASGNNVNYANMTFGQGLSVTTLQMAMAVTAIANGGKLLQPHLIGQIIDADGKTHDVAPKVVNQHVTSTEVTKQVTNMMVQVVLHGSGYLAQMKGYQVAGKTGTAQVPRADGQGYETGNNIGSFAGFAPVGNPKFVIMVRINKPQVPGFAESTTVPVFAGIANWLVQYLNIPPTG